MLDINFSIDNPWSKKSWALVHNWVKPLSKNKTFDATMYCNQCLFRINFSITHKTDHAGLRIDLGLFGWGLDMAICDNRHWDQTNNRWQV